MWRTINSLLKTWCEDNDQKSDSYPRYNSYDCSPIILSPYSHSTFAFQRQNTAVLDTASRFCLWSLGLNFGRPRRRLEPSNLSFWHIKNATPKLRNIVHARLTAAEEICASSSVPAKFHKWEDGGVIDEGKQADLVLLNANLLWNTSNTQYHLCFSWWRDIPSQYSAQPRNK